MEGKMEICRIFIDIFMQIKYNGCQSIVYLDHWFRKKRCLKFLIKVYKGNWLRPLVAMFI